MDERDDDLLLRRASFTLDFLSRLVSLDPVRSVDTGLRAMFVYPAWEKYRSSCQV